MRAPRRHGFRLLHLVLTLALIATATACASDNSGDTITLRYSFWGDSERAELYQESVDLFMKQHPNIKVKTNYAPFDAYFQKLATEAAGGNAPDVMQMDFAYIREYGDRGVLADLTPQLGKNLNTNDLVEGLEDAGKVRGKYYAVPVARNTLGMQYDPKLWRKAGAQQPRLGWTWSDYQQAAQKITAYTDGNIQGGSDLAWNSQSFEAFLIQHGKSMYTEDGKLGFTEDDLVEFWKMAAKMRQHKATSSPSRTIEAKPGAPISAGMTASQIEWDNLIVGNSSSAGTRLSVAPLPSNNNRLGQYLKPGMLMSVSSSTPHKAAATKLIDFFINEPKVAKILEANRGLPATSTQREAVQLKGIDADVLRYEDKVIPHLQDIPPAPPLGSSAVERTWDRLNEKVGFGDLPPRRAAQEFFRAAKVSLESAQQDSGGNPG